MALTPGCRPTNAPATSCHSRLRAVISPTSSQVATAATAASSTDHRRIAYQRVNRSDPRVAV